MKALLFTFFVFVALAAGAQTKNSQAVTTIHGTIADFTTKKPLKEAVAILYNAKGAELGRAKTNDRGNFSFGLLAAGTYDLKFEAAGYESQSRSKMPLKEGKRVRVAILLKPKGGSAK